MTEQPALLESLEQHFRRYLAIDPRLPFVLALWSLATFLFECFDAFPYLAITSPAKRCGKTRLAELLELVCANPLRTVGITPAALFRIIEKQKPSLIIDEAETLRGKDEHTHTLREILNAGYRAGQTVLRCVGSSEGGYKVEQFETYCPKVIVLIGSLPGTLADRCIAVQMRRHTNEPLERFRFGRAKEETTEFRITAKQWAEQNQNAVQTWYLASDLKFIEDREAELWLPLFAVCAVADPKRLTELESIAKDFAGAKLRDEPADAGVKLLSDIQEIFDCDRLRSDDLVSRLLAIPESPWLGWSHGRGLDMRSLAYLLRPFGIRSKNLRVGDGLVVKGYARGEFEDAWKRYLAQPSATGATRVIPQRDSLDSASATVAACSGVQNEEIANVYAGCRGVAPGQRIPPQIDLSELALQEWDEQL